MVCRCIICNQARERALAEDRAKEVKVEVVEGPLLLASSPSTQSEAPPPSPTTPETLVGAANGD